MSFTRTFKVVQKNGYLFQITLFFFLSLVDLPQSAAKQYLFQTMHAPLALSFLLFVFLFCPSCYFAKPRGPFDAARTPPPPEYSDLQHWAAHPNKNDPADKTPAQAPGIPGTPLAADVFFIHPTTLTGSHRSHRHWNGALDDERLNRKTDEGAILYQASIFNAAGNVYAPRYRQAHIQSFYGKDKKSGDQALDTAYQDVLAAFDYYLQHWNGGRPILLAGHSQGGLHVIRLLRDRFENHPLNKQLIAAYIVGWPVRAAALPGTQPCRSPDDTGCYCSWRTWERKFGRKRAFEQDVVCTNPLLWTIEEGQYAPATLNLGGVVRGFEQVFPRLADAEVYKGILLCTKPKFPGSFFFRRKNYHIGDLNLYYLNVRENAATRTQTFLKKP